MREMLSGLLKLSHVLNVRSQDYTVPRSMLEALQKVANKRFVRFSHTFIDTTERTLGLRKHTAANSPSFHSGFTWILMIQQGAAGYASEIANTATPGSIKLDCSALGLVVIAS
jgi:hypothetical protein